MAVILLADRPRLRRCRECQRDALASESSALTRLSCAFDAMYLCFVEVAEAHGIDVVTMEHPSADLISLSGGVLGLTYSDVELAVRRCDWCQYVGRLLPEPCNVEQALALAVEVCSRSVTFLKGETSDQRDGTSFPSKP